MIMLEVKADSVSTDTSSPPIVMHEMLPSMTSFAISRASLWMPEGQAAGERWHNYL